MSLRCLLAAAIAIGLASGCADQSQDQSSQAQATQDTPATAAPDDAAAASNAADTDQTSPTSANPEVVDGGVTVAVEDAWIRQPPDAAPVAGGYMILRNSGAADDRLVAARTAVAKDVEIHEMAMDGDTMKMRELPDGLPVPAGETVTLKPGGFHLMLMQPGPGIVAGKRIPLTLVFERGGEQVIEYEVREVSADEHGGEGHSDHGKHG